MSNQSSTVTVPPNYRAITTADVTLPLIPTVPPNNYSSVPISNIYYDYVTQSVVVVTS